LERFQRYYCNYRIDYRKMKNNFLSFSDRRLPLQFCAGYSPKIRGR
jgi:hypothetical protein